jgi:hypothetical protein
MPDIYYLAFPDDGWILKSTVSLSFILEWAQTIISMHDGWDLFVSGWGSPAAISSVGLSWFFIPMQTAMTSCVTQLFFAWRIWILSGKKTFLSYVIAVVSTTITLLASGAAHASTALCRRINGGNLLRLPWVYSQ